MIITGSLTAPGQTVVCTTDGALYCAWKIVGTYTGLRLAFEGSLDNSNWWTLGATRSTDAASFETATLSADSPDPLYSWFLRYGPFPYVRVRCLAITSGQADVYFRTYGTNPDTGVDSVIAADIHASDAASLSLSTSAAQTSALSNGGVYDLLCDTDCYIRIDPSTAASVTTTNGYRLLAGNCVPFRVMAGDKIGGILAAGSASLRYQRTHV